MYRHGDLLVEKIDELPKKLKTVKSGILVSSISTNHKHLVVGGDILANGEKFYIRVAKKATLRHDEHKDIELPKGFYQVIRQIEFNGYDNLIVQD
jgi:hypothetical protein